MIFNVKAINARCPDLTKYAALIMISMHMSSEQLSENAYARPTDQPMVRCL